MIIIIKRKIRHSIHRIIEYTDQTVRNYCAEIQTAGGLETRVF